MYIKIKNIIKLLLIICTSIGFCSTTSNNNRPFNYNNEDFKKDLFSPLKTPYSKTVLGYGVIAASTLVLTREHTILPLQEFISETKPLGELSNIGDIMGRMVPNIGYVLYQVYYEKTPLAKRRALYMTKASLFAGGTTFFLKRIFNQKRPNSSDRNSFPSGHTTTAFAFANVIANEHPAYKWHAYALASFVGASRINDNAHYIHDVIMGASIGIAFGESLKLDSRLSLIPIKHGGLISYNKSF